MSVADFIIAVFCLIDDELKKILNGKRLRQRGPSPGLQDSEVITMEIVGEFFGKDCDKTIWEYFKRHWMHFFQKIPDRSNFVRQAANLHVVKRMLQERLSLALGSYADSLHLIDGLPMPDCKFARAYFSKIFKGDAAYGYCAAKKVWHEASRFWRKLLAHTVCVKLSIEQEHEPLQFEQLVTA